MCENSVKNNSVIEIYVIMRVDCTLFYFVFTILPPNLPPNRGQFSKSKFSKTTRQILKVRKDSDRTKFTLLENIFTLNFCRVVFENLD